ncbi:MAG: BolA/IbaG family iron-sulfur metabolism protein [Cellvibrionaceae bacterium]
MQALDIKKLIEDQIENSEVTVNIEGNHLHLIVVSSAFSGLNTLKKQQMVYGAVNHLIADGTVHAVHMKTYTPNEWLAENN